MRVMIPTMITVGVLLSSCGVPAAERAGPRLAAPERPAGCTQVGPGDGLQLAIDRAAEGSAICLDPGEYAGPVEIRRKLQLFGPRSAVIRSKGTGTTMVVTGAGTRLDGFTIDGSGTRFDILDAALKLHGDDVVANQIRIRNATFGLLAEKTHRVVISGCEIDGSGEASFGLRGDALRLWETQDAIVTDNVITGARDFVVWYSSGNRIERNLVRGGRYGTHFMYSHRNVLADNRYENNVVGVFVMYSRDLTIERNLFADSFGEAGMGLGLKESGNLQVRDNHFIRNAIGIYLDTSPMQQVDTNRFEGNEVRLSRAGVVFHSSSHGNAFMDNTLGDNSVQVQVEGGGDALGVNWDRNDWDDYAGYDLDGDGMGDVPYELRSLTGSLLSVHPELEFFRGTPALGLADAVGKALPLLTPQTLVRDPHPRMRPVEERHAH